MVRLLVSILLLKKHLGVFQNLICLALSNWNKKNNFCTDIWKGSTGHVANFLLERSGIIFRSSGVSLQERNFDRETFKCSCGWSASAYCL